MIMILRLKLKMWMRRHGIWDLTQLIPREIKSMTKSRKRKKSKKRRIRRKKRKRRKKKKRKRRRKIKRRRKKRTHHRKTQHQSNHLEEEDNTCSNHILNMAPTCHFNPYNMVPPYQVITNKQHGTNRHLYTDKDNNTMAGLLKNQPRTSTLAGLHITTTG